LGKGQPLPPNLKRLRDKKGGSSKDQQKNLQGEQKMKPNTRAREKQEKGLAQARDHIGRNYKGR